MIDGFISLCRPTDQLEFDELVQSAKKDNHGVFIPTHPLKKNMPGGERKLVGYFSIGHPGAVICFAWLSTEEISNRESFHLINTVEDIVARGDGKMICFPVPKNSPFHPLMESMGYKNAGAYDFFIKPVV